MILDGGGGGRSSGGGGGADDFGGGGGAVRSGGGGGGDRSRSDGGIMFCIVVSLTPFAKWPFILRAEIGKLPRKVRVLYIGVL